MNNVQGFINVMEYFNTHTAQEALTAVYGRVFDYRDSYFQEKLQTFTSDKMRWIGQLDNACRERLNTLASGVLEDDGPSMEPCHGGCGQWVTECHCATLEILKTWGE